MQVRPEDLMASGTILVGGLWVGKSLLEIRRNNSADMDETKLLKDMMPFSPTGWLRRRRARRARNLEIATVIFDPNDLAA